MRMSGFVAWVVVVAGGSKPSGKRIEAGWKPAKNYGATISLDTNSTLASM
jgi:hypothetical protein